MRFVAYYSLCLPLALILWGCQPAEPFTAEAPPCAPSALNAQHPQAAAYQAALHRAVQQGIPGAVALVATPEGVWVGAAGAANLGQGTPAAPCHRGRIASLTKNVTAVAVLRLAQKGLLHLDQPATHYLPEGHPAHSLANASTATLRQLLNHTSGLYDYDTDTRYNLDALNQPGRVFTPADCFAYAKGKAATAAPGTEYRYCNTAYLLLGEVVGAVKEMPAQAAILAEVLQAANIPDTEWLASGSLPAHTLRGYDNRFGNARVTDVSHFRLGTGADGGLVSTVFDLRRYLTALYAQGSLLDSASLALMTQNRVTIPNTGGAQERSVESGLGVFRWQFRGNSCWANIGGQYGYRAFMAHFPENGSQLIVLANASLVGNDDPFFQLLDSLAEAIWP